MVPFDSVTPKTYEMTYYIHIPRLVNFIIIFDRSFWPPFWIFLLSRENWQVSLGEPHGFELTVFFCT